MGKTQEAITVFFSKSMFLFISRNPFLYSTQLVAFLVATTAFSLFLLLLPPFLLHLHLAFPSLPFSPYPLFLGMCFCVCQCQHTIIRSESFGRWEALVDACRRFRTRLLWHYSLWSRPICIGHNAANGTWQ